MMMMMHNGSRNLWKKMCLNPRILYSYSYSTNSLSTTLLNNSLRILGPDLPEIWIPNPSSPSRPPINTRRSPFIFNHQEQTAAVIDGKMMADEIRSEIANEVSRMKNEIGKVPGLAVVLVGERKDSQIYVRKKIEACEEVGIMSLMTELPEDCTEIEVLDAVSSYNVDPAVHGILVQLPLPQHMNEEKILNDVSLEKDVDGFHPVNMGNLAMTGRDPLFIPCTPKGCIELLLRSNVEIMGKKVVVIGRSNIAGLPTSLLLQRHHATVSVVHAFTKNPEKITREADIVISAAGVANLVRGHWLKPGAIVIDVGTNPVEDPDSESGYTLTGDVCYEEAIKVASAITPVPGGVGPMTIAMLLSNTLDSAKRAYRFP
ncbi:bifunctional protein FolD 1, mitochondrial-like [Papaver somniferum]|uniref:bifunctional protein FolD 1, mitochondrial-like n=1 Tax=Papaver somniferum TaxID=3469 RepID=UPI000E6F93ED|nr:bifunctional protein FolD 1, mitochondrial-like [Papaver somniferum]XP_026427548.1 bifunctional protein FolD 1, mitochondrial-like [Papaver somniferum]